MSQANGTERKQIGQIVITFHEGEDEFVSIHVLGSMSDPDKHGLLIRGCAAAITKITQVDPAAVQPASALWTPGQPIR